MLARVTNWSKKVLIVSMAALATMGYVACSEDDGADSSLNSPKLKPTKERSEFVGSDRNSFASPNFGAFSITTVHEGYLIEQPVTDGLLALKAIGVPTDSAGIEFLLDYFPASKNATLTTASERRLVLNIFDVSSGFRGFHATLYDTKGFLLWEYSFRNDLVTPDHFFLFERTLSDELIVETLTGDSSYMEVYTQNGIADTFVFPTTDRDSIRFVHENLISNTLSRQSSDPIVNELNRFDATYDTSSSLVANTDGQIVTDFLTSATFTRAVSGNIIDSSGNSLEYVIPDAICFIAAECAMLKCPAGAVVNAACDVCIAVTLACFIERVLF
ncbi:hypothetical protein JYU19_02425 [bacterium AH-315-J21]|nr:hypothetical protein [bacterium AH-315-J21]